MSGWWTKYTEENFWMFQHGFEPRAGKGVWMKELVVKDGKLLIDIKIQAPDMLSGRWTFYYGATYEDGPADALIKLEATAEHYTAFEPLLEMLQS